MPTPGSIFRFIAQAVAAVVVLGGALWAFGALHYDFPIARQAVAWTFAIAVLAALALVRGFWRKLGAILAGFVLVLAWWLTLRPSGQGDWQPDVARQSWAEIRGDEVTLHNVRHCEYRTEQDYTARWESRTVRLSQLTGIDMAINYWGSPWMAHPIVSFQFADAPPVAMSIETRKKRGQSYSAIGGLYRQFELIYLAADERDVIRVRTNFRKGEDVYLYRTTVSPERARERFLEYVATMNAMRSQPRWYNAVTTNCTTSIRSQRPSSQRVPWDWRMLLNGKGDEMLYARGALATDGLPFAELKARALANPAAQAAGDAADFSQRIRTGRPGFAALPDPAIVHRPSP